jgi:flagellar operon protein
MIPHLGTHAASLRPSDVAKRDRTSTTRGVPTAYAGRPFADLLDGALHGIGDITFSAHALQRLRERGIELTDDDKSRLADAVQKAADKGARESLVLMDHVALVVSVSNETVITAVPEEELEDAVFTNIDSAVLVRDPVPSAA